MSNRLDRNPFYHEGPVRDPALFFGRESDVRKVLRRVRKGASVLIVGEAKVGKTSFLHHVANPRVAAGHGLSPSKHMFFYVDCEWLAGLSGDDRFGQIKEVVERTVASLDGRLASALEHISISTAYDWFERAFSLFEVEGVQPIVQLDNFDCLATDPHTHNIFCENLRALTDMNETMTYILAFRLPLSDLRYETLGGSPFIDIFWVHELRPFNSEERHRFLAARLGSVGAAFPEFILESICDLSRGEPYCLQLAGACAYNVWCEHGCRLCEEHWEEIERRFNDTMAIGT